MLSGVLYSCSPDEIMVNNSPRLVFDTIPQYEWRMEFLPGRILGDLLVIDTSNIFLTSNPKVLKYDGNQFIEIDPGFDFQSNVIGSYDNQTIYFGGRIRNSPLSEGAILIKYLNGIQEVFQVPFDSTSLISHYYFEGPNKFWFSAGSNDVFYFDHGNFRRYSIKYKGSSGFFYGDQANNLFLFRSRFEIPGEDILDTYKYNPVLDSFELIISDPLYEKNGTDLAPIFALCGNDVVSTGYHSFSYFTGSRWLQYIDMRLPNSSYHVAWSFAGNNKDSLFFYDFEGLNPHFQRGIYSYVPGKINLEKKFKIEELGGVVYPGNLKVYGDRIYGTFNIFESSQALFVSGKKISKN